jgi:hypothetical protein
MFLIGTAILIAGVVLLCLGYDSIPHGQHLDARSNGSLFIQSSSAGAFLSYGPKLLSIGLLTIIPAVFLLFVSTRPWFSRDRSLKFTSANKKPMALDIAELQSVRPKSEPPKK